MRLFVLFLAVVLSFAVLRWLSPGSAEAGAGADVPPALEAGLDPTGEPRFLTPPGGRGATTPSRAEAAPAQDPPRPQVETPWPVARATPGEADELAVAAALVHGSAADVQGVSRTLGEDRGRLAEAFAWTLVGERQMALSLSGDIDRDALDPHERALFEAALTGQAVSEASAGSASPVARAMEMALLAREAAAALEAHEWKDAARDYSRLLVAELGAPWAADPATLAAWTHGLDQAQAHHRWDPRGDWPGVEMDVQGGDSLISVRKRFLAERPEAVMCTGLIERANDVRGYLQPGQKLRVPTDPARMYVDLEARWALYFLGDEVAGSWPVCIGRPGEETPPGDYRVKNKIENPPWMKVGQEAIPYGDPRNPLGTRWIGWEQDGRQTSYGFHGTTDPSSIGTAGSDGCVRLRNEDVEVLFKVLPEGAQIRVVE